MECLKPKLALGDTKPIWKHQDILILIQQLRDLSIFFFQFFDTIANAKKKCLTD